MISSTSLQSDKLNVAFITLSLSRSSGGIFESVRALATGLSKADNEVKAIGPWDSFTDSDACKWGGVQTLPYQILGARQLGYSWNVKRLIRDCCPDIQHVHGIWMYHSFANYQVAKQQNKPYVVSPHGMLDQWAIGNSKIKKRIAWLAYEGRHLSGAACIHALCDAEAKAIREMGLTNPICVIPNGVDLPELEHINATKTNNLKTDTPRNNETEKTLLFLGRIHPKKGLENLIRAFDRIHQDNQSAQQHRWKIVIAGWDQEHQTHLESLPEFKNSKARIEFVGPKYGEQKAETISACDAFVLPSLSEGLPMSVLEAWSYQKPVLLTENCNLPDGRQYGAAIEVRSTIEDMEKGLRSLFKMSNHQLQEMGIAGRKLVERKYDWSIVSQQMADVYRWICGRTPTPDTIQS